MFVDFERSRPRILDGIAQAMQRADAGIAAPGERELARGADADQLVVEQIGRHAHEMQVPPALPDQLVAGRERDEVREALEREAGAVGDVLRDRF